MPAEVTYVSDNSPDCVLTNGDVVCDFGVLAGGATTSFTITVTLDASAQFTNSASVSTTHDDTNSANDMAEATICVVPTNVAITGLAADYLVTDSFAALTGSPPGGVFSGPGIADSAFFPSVAGTGSPAVVYIYTVPGGCATNAIAMTTVSNPSPATIGDFVWHDINGDQVQDVGEPGIAGATVDLYRPGRDGLFGTLDDIRVATRLTDGSGAYEFVDVAPGAHRVVVGHGSAPLAGLGLTTGNNPYGYTLAPGEDHDDADFGYRSDTLDASIGDAVWNDLDADGVQDGAPEFGIGAVTVDLVAAGPDGAFGTADDVTVATTTTGGSGACEFTGLPAGNYLVDVDDSTLPANVALTTANEPLVVKLAVGEARRDADFGYGDPETASIGDFVWNDLNGDGVQDGGAETGLVGVAVRLLVPGFDGLFGTGDDLTFAAQSTDTNGAYDFTGLAAGDYRVDVDESTLPAGFGITAGNEPDDLSLALGQDYNAADFGCVDDSDSGSIGDLVWTDTNGNGVFDGGDVGLAGVTVHLVMPGIDGIFGSGDDVAVATNVTDGTGAYDFAGRSAGNYRVDVDETTLPPGSALTTGNEPLLVQLSVAEDYDDADFGYVTDVDSGSIGDLVWSDLNGDGVQDFGEIGIAGVTVNLTEAGPDGVLGTGDDVSFPPQVTDAAGAYDFTGLSAGLYEANVDEATLPAGLGLTTGNEPLIVRLVVDEDYDDADFGYSDDAGAGSIGDYVWQDDDGDGIQDPTETGFPAIRLTLYGAGPDGLLDTADDVSVGITATDALGGYLFAGLAASPFRVDVDDSSLPADHALTTANDPFDLSLSVDQAIRTADFGYEFVPSDFGDAPDPTDGTGVGDYTTLVAGDGARHLITGPSLGEERDGEPDGQPNVAATGDDVAGVPDDEDGVTFGVLEAGQSTSVTVNVQGGVAILDAWIDFNQDGVWESPTERISTKAMSVGDNIVPFTVPCNASTGTTYARFRLSTAGGLAPTGAADDGEVEDYQVTIVPDSVPPALTCATNVTIACGESTNTANTGLSTATDNCDTNVAVTFVDTVTGACATVILRAWTPTAITNDTIDFDYSTNGASYYRIKAKR